MFLDSNIFINFYVSHGKEGQACAALMKRINGGEQKASTSPLVVDEVIYFLIGKRGLPFAQKALQTILMNQNIQMLPIDNAVLMRLPDYLENGLEARDAMHAATMQVYSISTICSFDRAFDKIKGIKRQVPK
jgi:predicted nucleic acid-binding protein